MFNYFVSIPQAVSTIAIEDDFVYTNKSLSFNTASGKYYCNHTYSGGMLFANYKVSIPQAVSTIAIRRLEPYP